VLDHQRIGGLFRSIAYPGGGVDIDITRFNTQAQLGGLSMQLYLSRAEDNVNDLDGIPNTGSKSQALNFNYTPTIDAEKWPRWLQSPTLSAAFSHDTRETIRMPVTSQAFAVDQESTGAVLSLAFVHPYGNWGLSFSPAENEDHTGNFGSTRSSALALDSSFQLGPRYTVVPQLTFDRVISDMPDVTTRTYSVGVGQQFVVIQDVLDAGLYLNQNRVKLSDDSQETTTETADFNLDWRTPFLEGLSLCLRGSYYRNREETDLAGRFGSDVFYEVPGTRDYQVFVGASYQFQSGQ
jgi:hypothetical protein